MKLKERRRICFKEGAEGVKAKVVFDYLVVTRFLMSVKQTKRIHLGTRVKYDGKVYWVANAVGCLTLRNRTDVYEPVHVSPFDVKKVRSWANLKHDALAWFRWYVESWLVLDFCSMMHGEKLASVRILGKRSAHGRRRWLR